MWDEISYPYIDEAYIPPGSAEVDAWIDDGSGQGFDTVLIAGNIGMKVTSQKDGDGDTVENILM